MVSPNEVLAFAVLAGLVGVVGWTLYRNTRRAADVDVRSIDRTDDGVALTVALTNALDHAMALEEVDVTKVKDGPESKAWVTDVDDDIRVPIEADGRLEGLVELRCVGDEVPDGARLRVLFVFRSPSGAEMAETWVEV